MITGYETPNIIYNSIKINNSDISLSTTVRGSFIAPYNRIDFVMTPQNCSLSYYEVRITKDGEDYDIGIGTRAYWDTNIQSNVAKSFHINIDATNFSKGDGLYRISLYGKSSIDGSWDVTYLLFTVNNEKFVPIDFDGFEVLTDREIP